MRSLWEALHRRLVGSIATSRAHRGFADLRKSRKSLERFPDPTAFLDFVHDREQDMKAKDTIYRELVREIQADSPQSQLAMDLIWLGLWPGLDAAYRNCLRFYFGHDGDLASAMAACLCLQARSANLDAVKCVVGTLVRNTKRDVLRRRFAQLEEDKQCSSLDDKEVSSTLVAEDALLESETLEWVRKVGGPDADLIVLVVFVGANLNDASSMLGISYEAARKRFQRALKRLRQEF